MTRKEVIDELIDYRKRIEESLNMLLKTQKLFPENKEMNYELNILKYKKRIDALQLAISDIEHKDELQTKLDAWYFVFGTTQLTHAEDRLRLAEIRAEKYIKALPKLELLDKVEKGGLKKKEFPKNHQEKCVCFSCLRVDVFNCAIDLCNAHWANKMKGIEEVVEKSIRCRVEEKDEEEILYPTHSLKMSIIQAIINHLTSEIRER